MTNKFATVYWTVTKLGSQMHFWETFTYDAVGGHILRTNAIWGHMYFLSQMKCNQTWIRDALWEHITWSKVGEIQLGDFLFYIFSLQNYNRHKVIWLIQFFALYKKNRFMYVDFSLADIIMTITLLSALCEISLADNLIRKCNCFLDWHRFQQMCKWYVHAGCSFMIM